MSKTNEDLFLDLLEKNKAQILRISAVYSRDEEEKKDLYQEVVINLWKSLGSFRGESAISTWVYRVALNTCMQASIKSRRRSTNHTRIESIHFNTLQTDDESSAKQERIRQLYACIRQLGDIDRNIVMLSLDELSYKDIAAITGLTENHVAVRMKRLKEKLFNCLNRKL